VTEPFLAPLLFFFAFPSHRFGCTLPFPSPFQIICLGLLGVLSEPDDCPGSPASLWGCPLSPISPLDSTGSSFPEISPGDRPKPMFPFQSVCPWPPGVSSTAILVKIVFYIGESPTPSPPPLFFALLVGFGSSGERVPFYDDGLFSVGRESHRRVSFFCSGRSFYSALTAAASAPSVGG